MRKAALATALTLLLSLSTTPTLLSGPSPGASNDAGLGYVSMATDFIYPVGNPRIAPTFAADSPNGYRISQMFNNSCNPALNQGFYLGGVYYCGHSGVDLTDLQEGGPVAAVANGVVVYAGYASTYGEMVRIQHLLPDGSYIYSQYEHMLWGSVRVWTGETVAMGQVIGLVGATGFVTGAHLHLEIKSVNDDGPGYTFGNDALIIGYDEPISWIAAHMQVLLPTATATPVPPTFTPTATPVPPTSIPATSVPATPTSQVAALSATAPAATSVVSVTNAGMGGGQQGTPSDFYSRYPSYVTVTADGLNVHAGSDFTYLTIASVPKGSRLGYLGMSGNGWVRVALPSGVTGYVVRQWVTGGPLPDLPPVTMSGNLQPPFVTVQDTRYPARNGPMMHDDAIEALEVGEQLTYLGTYGSWDKVVLPSGRVGWVLNWYLKAPTVQSNVNVTPDTTAADSTTEPSPSTGGTTPAPTATAVAASSASSPRPHASAATVTVIVDGLHLRAAPSLSARVLTALPKGTALTVRWYDGSWVAVTAPNGTRGYVAASLVRSARRSNASAGQPATSSGGTTQQTPATSSASHGPAAGYKAPFVAVNARGRNGRKVKGANLRAAPNIKSALVTSEANGTRLALLGSRDGWDRVETPQGVVAWIRVDLVRAA